MAGKLTLWGAGEMLRVMFSRSTSAPPSFYLALIKDVAPTPYISGSELDEPTAAEYARVEIPNEISVWNNDSQINVIVCDTDINYVTAIEDWGTIRYWALCNAPVEGYVYMVGDFASPNAVNSGNTASVPAGNLTASLGPFYSAQDS